MPPPLQGYAWYVVSHGGDRLYGTEFVPGSAQGMRAIVKGCCALILSDHGMNTECAIQQLHITQAAKLTRRLYALQE